MRVVLEMGTQITSRQSYNFICMESIDCVQRLEFKNEFWNKPKIRENTYRIR